MSLPHRDRGANKGGGGVGGFSSGCVSSQQILAEASHSMQMGLPPRRCSPRLGRPDNAALRLHPASFLSPFSDTSAALSLLFVPLLCHHHVSALDSLRYPAAITAAGGATLISQSKSHTFRSPCVDSVAFLRILAAIGPRSDEQT